MSQLWVWIETLAEVGVQELTVDEARHVISRRLRVGDSLTVFDAQGKTACANVTALVRKSVEVDVGPIDFATEPHSGFRLATAIPKGERLSAMLQMWTQLGLEVWQPLICEDSAIRKLDPDSSRLRRILIEGCKVARRPWAMRILPPLELEAALGSRDPETPLYYADQSGVRVCFGSEVGWVFVGPEAGFRRAEIERLESAGAKPLSLGPYNLRIETAGVAAMAVFNVSENVLENVPENALGNVSANRAGKPQAGRLDDGDSK